MIRRRSRQRQPGAYQLTRAPSIAPCSVSDPFSSAGSRRIASRLASKPGLPLTAEVSRQPTRQSCPPVVQEPDPIFGVPFNRSPNNESRWPACACKPRAAPHAPPAGVSYIFCNRPSLMMTPFAWRWMFRKHTSSACEGLSRSVSLPSSTASRWTATETVFAVSLTAKTSLPDVAVSSSASLSTETSCAAKSSLAARPYLPRAARQGWHEQGRPVYRLIFIAAMRAAMPTAKDRTTTAIISSVATARLTA